MVGAHEGWRAVYAAALNPEVFFDSENLRSLLQRGTIRSLDDPREPRSWTREALIARIADWRDRQRSRFRRLMEAASSNEMSAVILRQTTVLASTLGSWLQGMTAPGVFEDPLLLKLLTLLAADVGVGAAENSRWDQFKTLLRRHGLSQYAVTPGELCSLDAIEDDLFEFPALLLGMSRRSDAFAPELCGIDLCMRTVALLPCWELIKVNQPQIVNWSWLDLSASPQALGHSDLGDLSAEVIALLRQRDAELGTRASRAVEWCTGAIDRWSERVAQACEKSLDPGHVMARLLQERAREACCYHQGMTLGHQTLSAWFAQARDDPKPLLKALGESNLVRAGDSEHSPLLSILASGSGPMFRVLENEDLRVVRRWIDHLGRSTADDSSEPSQHPAPRLRPRAGDPSLGLKPRCLREAYFLLQGRALAPETRDFAIRYVTAWLKHSDASSNQSPTSLPRHWGPGILRSWLLDRHDQAAGEFQLSKDDAIPTREAVIHSTLQLAPLTLIDGSWLQGFTDRGLASSRSGFRLFQIYWDELGNGDYRINHPKLYRDVLRQMGIELPPTGSWDFAFDARFEEKSFRLPVYWLCLGKLPITCKTALLGMNLAMELSGVGGGYRSAHRCLQHYGFPTTFVDIHNTIDNVSTGHSAWAAQAIDAHMLEISACGGTARLDTEWAGIRNGYQSLNPVPSRKFARGYFRTPRHGAGDKPPMPDRSQLHHHTSLGTSLGAAIEVG